MPLELRRRGGKSMSAVAGQRRIEPARWWLSRRPKFKVLRSRAH